MPKSVHVPAELFRKLKSSSDIVGVSAPRSSSMFVSGTGSAPPDLAVIMSVMTIWAGWVTVQLARGELRALREKATLMHLVKTGNCCAAGQCDAPKVPAN